MSRLSQALQAINDRFHPMVFQRRMNFSHANPTRSLTTRQRSTVSHGFTHPGPPYDLFLTMSHVIATGVEHGVGESKINRVSDVVSNLFFLVEYTLDDPVEDLLSDSVITLHQFFRRYGIYPEYIELSDDETVVSPRQVADFPVQMPLADDETTISSAEEHFLVENSHVDWD